MAWFESVTKLKVFTIIIEGLYHDCNNYYVGVVIGLLSDQLVFLESDAPNTVMITVGVLRGVLRRHVTVTLSLEEMDALGKHHYIMCVK